MADTGTKPGNPLSDLAKAQGQFQQAEVDTAKAEAPIVKQIDDIATQMAGYHDEIQKLQSQAPKLSVTPFQAPQAENPMNAFVSLGGILGLISAFATKTPLTTALNASTAAMNAIKQNNADAYNQAFETWKANTDMAIKVASFQNEQYKNAIDLMNTDMAAGQARIRALGAAFDETQTMEMLMHGGPDKLADFIYKRADLAVRLQEVAGANAERGIRVRNYLNAVDEYKRTHGGKQPDAQTLINLMNESFSPAFAGTELKAGTQGAANDSLLGQIDRAISLTNERGAAGLGVTGLGGVAGRAVEFGESIVGGANDTEATKFHSLINFIAGEAQRRLAGGRFSTAAAEQMKENISALEEASSPESARAALTTLREVLAGSGPPPGAVTASDGKGNNMYWDANANQWVPY